MRMIVFVIGMVCFLNFAKAQTSDFEKYRFESNVVVGQILFILTNGNGRFLSSWNTRSASDCFALGHANQLRMNLPPSPNIPNMPEDQRNFMIRILKISDAVKAFSELCLDQHTDGIADQKYKSLKEAFGF